MSTKYSDITDYTVKVCMLKGESGDTIKTIEKTSSDGLKDTYTITFSNGDKHTFNIENGNGIKTIAKTSTSGLVDTYTITLTDGKTSTFTVTNAHVLDFDTVNDLKACTTCKEGDYCKTAGYSTRGDFGGLTYYISKTSNNYSVALNSGDLYAIPVFPETITPEMFGAVGDGITDDTDAVQKAIDYGANKVVLSAKAYAITGLTITTCNLIGAGIYRTRLKLKNEVNTNAITVKHMTDNVKDRAIQGFTLDCNGNNQTSGNGIVVEEGKESRSAFFKATDVQVLNAYADGWLFNENTIGSVLNRCIAESCGNYGFRVLSPDNKFYNCESYANKLSGFYLNGLACVLSGCAIYGNKRKGIDSRNCGLTMISDCSVDNNEGIGLDVLGDHIMVANCRIVDNGLAGGNDACNLRVGNKYNCIIGCDLSQSASHAGLIQFCAIISNSLEKSTIIIHGNPTYTVNNLFSSGQRAVYTKNYLLLNSSIYTGQ